MNNKLLIMNYVNNQNIVNLNWKQRKKIHIYINNKQKNQKNNLIINKIV